MPAIAQALFALSIVVITGSVAASAVAGVIAVLRRRAPL